MANTPKKIVVGAHYGVGSYLGVRVTAVVLVLYTFVLLGALLVGPELSYGTWAGLFAGPVMKVLTLLAFGALAYHAWVGMRNIYMDYIKPTGIRLALQSATIVALVGYTLWAATILWSV
jgi:succinate dehydrogenase / fumarate reductase membrane anchor subunit